tara:strand:- start:684 stop:1046 length:363 start_codon:yes stop_codon:yes gene_type:complete
MAEHPDNWVVIKITPEETLNSSNTAYIKTAPFYKVLAGWSGGYLGGDMWKLNSGIVELKDEGDDYHFIGHSGNVYVCDKGQYQLRMNTAGIWKQMQEAAENGGNIKLELMPEDTDWSSIL